MTFLYALPTAYIFFAHVLLFLNLFRFRFITFKEDIFPLSSNEQISSTPFLDLYHMTQSCVVLASSSQATVAFLAQEGGEDHI